jgi:hypothetical protein
MNFNDALDQAANLAKAQLSVLQEDVFLVRDLNGRIRVLLASPEHGTRTKKAFEAALKNLSQGIVKALGPYAYPSKELFLFRSELATLSLPTSATAPVLREDAGFKVCLHDRLLIGAEWSASPAATPPVKRFTLFSMKGGVGRSTTASVLAWHLAQKGKKVLVFDLDLESPGVGATLLGTNLPRFGIVDWFVEDVLGQGDAVLRDMVRPSTLATGSGSIAVVPAFGSDTEDYLAKLGRAYLERGPEGYESWPNRLKRLLEAIEQQETPDVVLLDSRTGLHDTSAALILAMGADTLMFAVDSLQTWTGYRFLFKHWNGHPHVRHFRHRLWLLGSMLPRQGTEAYFEGLRDHAHELFEGTLYDAPEVDGTTSADLADAFHFASTNEEGNHHPRPILFDDGLVAFDPLSRWQQGPVIAAYTNFFEWFDRTFLLEIP